MSRLVASLSVLAAALVCVAATMAVQVAFDGPSGTTVDVLADITLSSQGEVVDETGPLTSGAGHYSLITFEPTDTADLERATLRLRSYGNNDGATLTATSDPNFSLTYVLAEHAVMVPPGKKGDWVEVDITDLVKDSGRTHLVVQARKRASYYESESGDGPRLKLQKGKKRSKRVITPTSRKLADPPTADPDTSPKSTASTTVPSSNSPTIAPPTTTARSTTSTTIRDTSSTSAPEPESQPSISLVSPSDGSRVTRAGIVLVEARVTGATNPQVDFYAGGRYLGAEESPPYTFSWNVTDDDNGAHEIRAVMRIGSDDIPSNTRTLTIDIDAPTTSDPTGNTITALVETDPVRHGGDAADDPAIWIDRSNPARSTVIGTDKLGGLAVYDLSGRELHYYAVGRINNVDIRHDVNLNGRQIDLVAGSERDSDEIRFYEVDHSTRGLRPVGHVPSNLGVAGLCLFRDPASGQVSAFVGDSSGSVEHWELSTSGASVTGSKVRTIRLGSTTEGCAVDDAAAHLYISEEDKGIWRYGARSGSGVTPVMVDATTANGGAHLRADIEGLALWNGAGGEGYLVASSQSNNTFVIYDRQPPNSYVATFEVEAGQHDAVDYTDGIAITSADLGGAFSAGMFVAQDNTNGSSNQNFKLVSWADIENAVIGASGVSSEPAPNTPPVASVDPPIVSDDPPIASDPPVPPDTGDGSRYHVDRQRGDDTNSGSVSAPFETLEHATSVLNAGDTLLLQRGQTWSEKLEITSSGSASRPIVVDAYGSGDRPVITGSSSCIRLTGDHLTVRNLTARDCSWAGVRIVGKSAHVEGMLLTGNVVGAYVKSAAVDARIIDNDIIDNNVMSVNDAGGAGDSGAFGVLIHGRGTEVAYNTISGSDAFSHDYGRDGAAIEIFGAVDTHVHHNLAMDNDAFVELGEPGTTGNRFDHNVVISSLDESVFVVTRGGDSSRGPVSGTIVEHNSVFLSGANSQGFVCHGGCSTAILTLRNNVIEAQLKVGYADGPFVGANNVFHGGDLQFTLAPSDVVADPEWVDTGSGELRLQSTSAAIDGCPSLGYPTAFAGTSRPAGTVDCGAHQH